MTPLSESAELTLDEFDELFWEDLLAYIEEKRVIPIIGPDILSVVIDGQEVSLYGLLAKQLAERLSISANDLPQEFSINDVVCQHLRAGRRREDVYPRLRAVLRETQLPPPEALIRLAEITDFNLYVTITFDSLLEEAINKTRFNGISGTDVLAYMPTRPVDLPVEKERLQRPTVYHLLGKVAATPSYAACDEDVLEFVHTLQSQNFCPDKLFNELETNHLLILGCNFSDWLGRFFLRTAKRRRLSENRAELDSAIRSIRIGKDFVVACRSLPASEVRSLSSGFYPARVLQWRCGVGGAGQTANSTSDLRIRFRGFGPSARERDSLGIFSSARLSTSRTRRRIAGARARVRPVRRNIHARGGWKEEPQCSISHRVERFS